MTGQTETLAGRQEPVTAQVEPVVEVEEPVTRQLEPVIEVEEPGRHSWSLSPRWRSR